MGDKICIFLLRVHFKKDRLKDLFDDVYGNFFFFFTDFLIKHMS